MRATILLLLALSSPAFAQDSTGIHKVGQYTFNTWNSFDVKAYSPPYLYVNTGHNGLKILDASAPDSLWLAGEYRSDFRVSSVIVDNSRAYLTKDYRHIRVLDVSDPSTPQLLHADLDLGYWSYFNDIQVHNEVLFFPIQRDSLDSCGMRIYDVTDLDEVRLMDEFRGVRVQDYLVDQNRLFLIGHWSDDPHIPNQLSIYDVSDPANAQMLGNMNFTIPNYGLKRSGNYLFIGSGTSGFVSIDISDEANPHLAYRHPGQFAHNYVAIGANEHTAFFSDQRLVDAYLDGPIVAFDFSNPEQLERVGNLSAIQNYTNVFVGGNRVIAARYPYQRIVLLDVTNPAQPLVQGTFNPSTNIIEPLLVENRLYYIDDCRGFGILDMSDPTHPDSLSYLPALGEPNRKHPIAKLLYQDDKIHIAYQFIDRRYEYGMMTIDVRDDRNPRLVFDGRMPKINDWVLYGITLLTADSSGVVSVYTVDQGNHIVRIGEFRDRRDGKIYNLCRAGDFFYGLQGYPNQREPQRTEELELLMLDASNPFQINVADWREAPSRPVGMFPTSLKARGSYLYLGCQTIWLSRIANHQRPGPCFQTRIYGGSYFDVVGDRYIIEGGASQLIVWSLRNAIGLPDSGRVVGEYGIEEERRFGEVAASGNIVAAMYGDTLGIFDITELMHRLEVESPEELPPVTPSVTAFPNPFNSTTTLTYTAPSSEWTKMEIVDIRGRVVSELASGRVSAGRHTVTWNAEGVPAGVYVVRLEAGTAKTAKKVVLLK